MRYKITALLAAVSLMILACSYIVFEQKAVSDLENRSLTTFQMIWDPVTNPESEIYNAEKSAVDRLEDALKDQFFLRDRVVLTYSKIDGYLSKLYTRAYLAMNPIQEPVEEVVEEEPVVLDFETYPLYGYPRLNHYSDDKQYYLDSVGQNLYRLNGTDWIVSMPSTEELSWTEEGKPAASLAQLKEISARYPHIKIYNYFVTRIDHTPWFDRYLGVETTDCFEWITRYLPEQYPFAQLTYEDAEEFQQLFYKSDHHWNHMGSAQGYRDVHEMMREDLELSPVKEPAAEWNFTEMFGVKFRGSRAKKLGGYYDAYDDFIVYEYDLGERDCYAIYPKYLDKEIPVTLTQMEKYKAGKLSKERYKDHYVNFYGVALDKNGTEYKDSKYMFKIVNHQPAEHNLLIVGDSTQRAMRDPIASHFGTTIHLDYRIMSQVSIDEIIERYDIDTILIGGYPNAYWFNETSVFSFSSDSDM